MDFWEEILRKRNLKKRFLEIFFERGGIVLGSDSL